ncbi:ribonuclease T2 [Pelodytes ibericus]
MNIKPFPILQDQFDLPSQDLFRYLCVKGFLGKHLSFVDLKIPGPVMVLSEIIQQQDYKKLVARSLEQFKQQAMVSCFPYGLALVTFMTLSYASTYDPVSLRKSHEWTKLILTHHWPVTVCEMDKVKCENPPNYWTLHGLWPDKSQMCNNSWHFDYAEIQDILPEMNKWWPDVLHPNRTQLWKHEWQKHGTCAASLESLNSQHKYFSKGLELYKKFDLNSALQKAGITPSTKYYQMKDITNAIINLYGVVPKIQCLPPQQGEDAQTLGQIEVCFTKEFQMRNCSDHGHTFQFMPENNEELKVCNQNLNTYYPPSPGL